MQQYYAEILPRWEGRDVVRCCDRRRICTIEEEIEEPL